MYWTEIIGIVGSIASIIGIVLAVIGIMCLSKANKLSAKTIENSNINQAETITINTTNNGTDTYAVFKIARDATKEELDEILPQITAQINEAISSVNLVIGEIPRIHSGTGPPPDYLKDGDIYVQYE